MINRYSIGRLWLLIAMGTLFACGRNPADVINRALATRSPFPDRSSSVAFGVRTIGGPEEIQWLDNDRVLFVGYKVLESKTSDGAKPEVEPLPAIYIWNVRSNTYERHASLPPRWFICFNRGFIAYATEQRPDGGPRAWRAGMLGHEEPVPDEIATNEKALKPCLGWPREEPRVEDPTAVAISLAPEDGYIKIGEGPRLDDAVTPENQDTPVELVRPGANGSIALPIWKKEMQGLAPMRFSKFADKYVLVPRYARSHKNYRAHTPWPHDEPIPIYLISHDGRVEVVELPAGSPIPYGAYPTRRGLLWASNNAPTGNSRQAGAWLLDHGRVQKIFDHMVSAIGVSPDGCKVAYAVNDYDRSTIDVVHLMNLCGAEEGGEQ